MHVKGESVYNLAKKNPTQKSETTSGNNCERIIPVTPRMRLKLSNSELKLDLKNLDETSLMTEKPAKMFGGGGGRGGGGGYGHYWWSHSGLGIFDCFSSKTHRRKN